MRGKLDQQPLQQQRLVLSAKMKQSLHLLKLPITELSSMIRAELEQNPLLEAEEPEEMMNEEEAFYLTNRNSSFSSSGEEAGAFIENSYAEEESLFTFLYGQIREHLKEKHEFQMAREIIGSINEKGFFEGNLTEMAQIYDWPEAELFRILKIIQELDPPGIGSRDLRELLLCQLERKGQKNHLSYRIIEEHYDAMIHNRIPMIAKALHSEVSLIYEVIQQEIAALELAPGREWQRGHYREKPHTVTADVTIEVTESAIKIDVNEEKIPHIRINEKYLALLHQEATEEAKVFLTEKLNSGKSLLKNLYERNQTLYRIAEEIATYQSAYFINPKAILLPMTMKELGERLNLHESTIARAANGKYMNTPRGLVAMRTFFTHGYATSEGERVSSTSVKDLVKEMIAAENPKNPYSDEKIAEMIEKKGVQCARRTIAKYRKELGLGNRGQRRRIIIMPNRGNSLSQS